MIITAVLNGWNSSSGHTRTHQVTEKVLESRGLPFILYGAKSSFLWSRSREVLDFVLDLQDHQDDLLLVGKSLGAAHMIERVLNVLKVPLKYSTVHLLTIDPNWPTFSDWTPNLNGRVLHLNAYVDRAINLYVLAESPRQQAGAIVTGPAGMNLRNVIVTDADHYSIVERPVVREMIEELVR